MEIKGEEFHSRCQISKESKNCQGADCGETQKAVLE